MNHPATKSRPAADWTALAAEVNDYGCALTGPVLTPAQCRS
ncbi:MAG: hypothetical protein QOD41_82, partial [Cryptosporangiaceae bacterium]|nr:hypothetical protein [Cryptosporangiaceae bacterium]